MRKNIYIRFAAIATTINLVLSGVEEISMRINSEQGSAILGFINFLLFIYVFFVLIVKIIYKFAEVENTKKPSHRQLSKINYMWFIWLSSVVIVPAVYAFAFGNSISVILPTIIVGGILVGLAYIINRQKIMGHHKKDLFQ